MINLIITIILSIISFFMIFSFTKVDLPDENYENIEILEQSEYTEGVWVSTIYNLDFPSHQGKEMESIRAELDDIVTNSYNLGIDEIFFQVRPSADALYYSEIFPPSVYVTGSQDIELNFDILDYLVKKAHSRGIKVHAWINPYRITKNPSDILASDHIALQKPELTVKASDGNLYFNPGLPEARQLILDGAKEILENYDVDGIHIDDYFYPTVEFDDSDAYFEYGNGLELADFRRESVNTLVNDLHILSNSYGKVFGVSPSGIWANSESHKNGSDTLGSQSYFDHYADSKLWIEEGIIDYIAPQIYWEIGNDVADYEVLVKWWSDVVYDTDVKLFIGHANYKEDEEIFDKEEISRQINLNKNTENINGSIYFRYENLIN